MGFQKAWGRVIYASERVVATNTSSWFWEDDSSDRVATIYLNETTGALRLEIREVREKTGLGAGRRESVLATLDLGNIRKPTLVGVRRLLAKFGHPPSRSGSPFKAQWSAIGGKRAGLGEILADVAAGMAGPSREKVDGMRAAIMDRLDHLTPGQVKTIFDLVHNPATIRVGGA